MDRMIFVTITIAALGVVGVTTSIMNSMIPAHAQGHTSCNAICLSGHYTVSVPQPGTDVQTFNGHIQEGSVSGGGKATCVNGQPVTVQGSPGFKALAGNTVTC